MGHCVTTKAGRITGEGMTREHLEQIRDDAEIRMRELRDLGLCIDMSRGIPAREQLRLSDALLDDALIDPPISADDVDCRNYGGQQGILDARRLLSPLLGVPEAQVIVHGNSSLALMYECIALAWRKGVPGGTAPWSAGEHGATFICVVPGYDRHFAMCEDFGIRMIRVDMLNDGPDVDAVRRLVATDPSIKGMWCVPKYSNPTGTVYSDEVVKELATMPTLAPDFRLFWDNAYAVHPLADVDESLANLYEACVGAGTTDRALIFTSTSKMTHPGSGVAAIGASEANIRWWLDAAGLRSVGPDKLNQLRQARFLRSPSGVKALMEQHRLLLKPKFDLVSHVFERHFATSGLARWTSPKGGYFVSLEVVPGTAAKTVALAQSLGVKFATAGSCFPYRDDPDDVHLRIAPSYPAIEDLALALETIAVCTLKSAADELLRQARR